MPHSHRRFFPCHPDISCESVKGQQCDHSFGAVALQLSQKWQNKRLQLLLEYNRKWFRCQEIFQFEKSQRSVHTFSAESNSKYEKAQLIYHQPLRFSSQLIVISYNLQDNFSVREVSYFQHPLSSFSKSFINQNHLYHLIYCCLDRFQLNNIRIMSYSKAPTASTNPNGKQQPQQRNRSHQTQPEFKIKAGRQASQAQQQQQMAQTKTARVGLPPQQLLGSKLQIQRQFASKENESMTQLLIQQQKLQQSFYLQHSQSSNIATMLAAGDEQAVTEQQLAKLKKKFLVFRPYEDPISIRPFQPPDRGYYFKLHKCDVKIIRYTLEDNGFREIPREESKDWTIMWSCSALKSQVYQTLQKYQKINHFPHSYYITRKDLMYKQVSRMREIHGQKHFNFIPKTFLLPNEFAYLEAEMEKDKEKLWIAKPAASSQGKGIIVTNKLAEIPQKGTPHIVSEYIHNPLLFDGFKFDLRVYVAITSINPLRLYIYEDGLTRFATGKYNNALCGQGAVILWLIPLIIYAGVSLTIFHNRVLW